MSLEVTSVPPDDAAFSALTEVLVDSQLDVIDDWRRHSSTGHPLDLKLLKDGQWVVGGGAYIPGGPGSPASLTTVCSLFEAGELEMIIDAFPVSESTEWWVRGSSVQPAAKVAELRGLAISRKIDKMVSNIRLEPGVDVVAFRPEDAKALAAINNAAFADHKDRSQWTAETVLDEMKTLGNKPDDIRLAKSEDQIEGFVWTRLAGPHSGEIQVLAVDPAANHHGHGRNLLRAGMDHLHRMGANRVFLYVDSDNVRAKKIYEASGFVDAEESLVSYLIEPK